MPTEGETLHDNLAGNDQAASRGQSDAELWMQKYNGLNGKLLTTQTQLSEARLGYQDERTKWDSERKQLADQLAQVQAAHETTQTQLNDLMGKWSGVAAQSETLAAQVARQRVMLQHPHLISEPIMKLVENSTLTADDLAATLGAMAQGQQQLVKQVYQEAQSGATPAVGQATAQGASAQQDLAKASWDAAIAAMQKGDMATYRTEYNKYLSYADKAGLSTITAPKVLASKSIF